MLRAALLLALLFAAGAAQAAAPSSCGPTSVGTSPVNVTFPASGASGPTAPTQYVSIGDPSASAGLWVNPTGTAGANAAGSFYIAPQGAPLSFTPPPFSISIVATSSGTPVTCLYQ